MALDQISFRSTLASILSIDPQFIIPKQGNWFNPQDTLIGSAKPDTWVAFKVDRGKPVVVPFLQDGDTEGPSQNSITWYKGFAEIQFMGVRGEDIAQSVSHWPHRADVKAAFAAIDAELMMTDLSYKTYSYYQDGLNTSLAYRVTLNILHANVIETAQELWTATVPGTGMFS
jgi:hypothetical protein